MVCSKFNNLRPKANGEGDNKKKWNWPGALEGIDGRRFGFSGKFKEFDYHEVIGLF